MSAATSTHYRTCNLCEAMCGLEIKTKGKEIISIKGDKEDVLSNGHICPKAVALQDIYYDKDRLKHPVKKTAGGWQQISWEEAFNLVISNIKKTQKQYGNNAVGLYFGNPNVHNLGSSLFIPAFIKAVKTINSYSATSVDQLPHHFAAYYMMGNPNLMPVPDINRTDYWLIIGANPLVSNGSLMTAPDVANRLKAIRKRGGKVVVIDPRRTETAKKADAHHFIKPGSDALFLMALIHEVDRLGKIDLGHLKDHVEGVETILAIAKDFSPEKVASSTGIPAAEIRQIALDFAEAPSAVCYPRMGASTQRFGGLCLWLGTVLNLLTSNLDQPGGAMLTSPAFDSVARQKPGAKKHGRWKSRLREAPEFGGELPVSTLAEEILTEGEGQIRLMGTCAGNPILSTPNSGQLEQAFEGLDFMFAIDIYINETTRHADVILPVATGLEVPQYDIGFHNIAIHNTVKYADPLFEKEEGMKYDWEVLAALAEGLSGKPANGGMTALQLLDMALQFGPYKLTLEKLRAAPHGIDLGPLQTVLPDRLFTTDKKIQLAPEVYLKDIPRLKTTLDEKMNGKLLLIGRRQLRTNNSWMHNSYRLVKGKNRCTLLIHPDDAAKKGIENGAEVNVLSNVGKIVIEAEVSEEMMPGVVSIPHGWGHDKEGVEMEVAQAHAGVNINDLTDDTFVDVLTGNAALSGVPVEVN